MLRLTIGLLGGSATTGLHNSPERGRMLCKIAQIRISPRAVNGSGRRADEGPTANDRDA